MQHIAETNVCLLVNTLGQASGSVWIGGVVIPPSTAEKRSQGFHPATLLAPTSRACRAAMFCLSSSLHGLQHTEHSIALGQHQLTHLLHLGTQQASGKQPTVIAALPCRYQTSSPRFYLSQHGEVAREAFGFTPMLQLGRNCSTRRVITVVP